MEEHSAMCEKILLQIELLLDTNIITEFSLIPATNNDMNKSPVHHHQNSLGLESWCKKFILIYTHNILAKNRKPLINDQLTIEKMKNLNHCLIGCLMLQPNETTFWNMKRELVNREILSEKQEFNFSQVVLSQYPKCLEVFSYRKWLLNSMDLMNNLSVLQEEFVICERAAEGYRNNYHAWNHRIWCLKKVFEFDLENFLNAEFIFSKHWIMKHVSENAGYYYRQILIELLNSHKNVPSVILKNLNMALIVKYFKFSNFCDVNSDDPSYIIQSSMGNVTSPLIEDSRKCMNMVAILLNELIFVCTDFMSFFGDHESVWNYRRFIFIYVMKHLYNYYDIKFDFNLSLRNNISSDINFLNLDTDTILVSKPDIPKKMASSKLYVIILKNEMEFIEKQRNSTNSMQNHLADRFLKWLKCTNFYYD